MASFVMSSTGVRLSPPPPPVRAVIRAICVAVYSLGYVALAGRRRASAKIRHEYTIDSASLQVRSAWN